MNGFEIGMILLALALACLWMSTPAAPIDEAKEFREALLSKQAAQTKAKKRGMMCK